MSDLTISPARIDAEAKAIAEAFSALHCHGRESANLSEAPSASGVRESEPLTRRAWQARAPMEAKVEENQRYLTRDQIAEFARVELGIPLTVSAINKAAANGHGPTPKARYGNAYLYEKAAALEWAKTTISVEDRAENGEEKFNQRFVIHLPQRLLEAIDKAAEQKMMTRSAYVRAALVERLREDGFMDN